VLWNDEARLDYAAQTEARFRHPAQLRLRTRVRVSGCRSRSQSLSFVRALEHLDGSPMILLDQLAGLGSR